MYYRCINSVLAYLYACSQNWSVSAKAQVRGGRSLSPNTFEKDVTNCAYVTLTFHLELAIAQIAQIEEWQMTVVRHATSLSDHLLLLVKAGKPTEDLDARAASRVLRQRESNAATIFAESAGCGSAIHRSLTA